MNIPVNLPHIKGEVSPLSPQQKDLLKDIFQHKPEFSNYLDNQEFSKLYAGLDPSEPAMLLTKVLLLSGIDPLENMKSLPRGMFINQRGLETVKIPDSVESLGTYCFSGCSWLYQVSLSNKLTFIPENCFALCSRLNDIVIPQGVVYIATGAFTRCGSLESVGLPKSLDSVDGGAFFGCDNLKHVYYDGSLEEFLTLLRSKECEGLRELYYLKKGRYIEVECIGSRVFTMNDLMIKLED